MREHIAGKHFANDEDLKDAGWITGYPHGIKRVLATQINYRGAAVEVLK